MAFSGRGGGEVSGRPADAQVGVASERLVAQHLDAGGRIGCHRLW